MKIASVGSTRTLCEYLYTLLADPPPSVVIGRLVDGPNRWFGWNNINAIDATNGYEAEYYRIVDILSQTCKVDHFAVCPTYHHESAPAVQLTSLTKMVRQGIRCSEHGEPYTLWANNVGFRGYAAEYKLCLWLEHWTDTKQHFHTATYTLWGEKRPTGKSFKDKLFHYSAHGMVNDASIIGKTISCVQEKFVTEKHSARTLVDLFHTVDFEFSGVVVGTLVPVPKNTFKKN